MKQFIFSAIILAVSTIQLRAQVGVNKSDSNPDFSAILELSSTEMGMLLPRMTSAERTLINNPAQGLIVYDNETTSFWFYNNGQWNEIRNGANPISTSDLVDPENIASIACTELIGAYEDINNGTDLKIRDQYAYVVGTGTNDFHIINISDPFNPTEVSTLPAGFRIEQIALQGNYAYLLDRLDKVLIIFDIVDPTDPTLMGSASISQGMDKLAVSGDYAYISNGTGQDLSIINVSDPANPVVDTTFIPGSNLRDLAIQGNYLYVLRDGGNNEGLLVYDLTTPDMPNEIGSVSFGEDPISMTVSGNYVYVGEDDEGFYVVEISDPANPTLIGSLPIEGEFDDITVEGNYAFLIDDEDDDLLVIINIQDPANPYLETEIGIGSSPEAVAIDGEHVYITYRGSEGLEIFDITCPQQLVIDPSSGAFSTENQHWTLADASGAIKTNFTAEIGNVDLNTESATQDSSIQNDKGLLSTPWVYTVAVEAHDERDTSGTALIVGNDSNISNNNQIHLVSGGTSALMVRANRNVGIGTTAPDYKLQVGELADGTIARSNVWDTFSDRRLKRNFQFIPDPLEKLQSLNGYYYHWQTDRKDQSQQVGLLAQEVEAIFPEVVSTDSKGIKSLDYSKLTALLIETNKALRTKVEAFKAANIRFEQDLLRLQGRIRSRNSNDID